MNKAANPPYLLINSEYDIFRNGKLDLSPFAWEDAPEELKPLVEATDWIGSRIRNWESMRDGGDFSQITNACWLFVVRQDDPASPVLLEVYTEIGRYAGDDDRGLEPYPSPDVVRELLENLRGTEPAISYEVSNLDRHPDYFLFKMLTPFTSGDADALWSEMLRVTEELKNHSLLRELRNWIL